jgi:A/G-specific adenine glycosylase
VGAVDTNVRRVLRRALFDEAPSPRVLQAAADELVPADRPGEWTHALMDVGATFCRPRNPRCATCPLQPWCRYAAGTRSGAVTASPMSASNTSARPAAPFESTSRWLRGRILDRLRDAADGGWVAIDSPIGGHSRASVAAALAALASEGLLEMRDDVMTGARTEARLPIS